MRPSRANQGAWLCLLLTALLVAGMPTVSSQSANEPPAVTVDNPQEGDTVAGVVNVTGTASDTDGALESVEVSIDEGPWQPADGTEAWHLELNTTNLTDGEHSITARAFDGMDHSENATVNVTVDNSPDEEQEDRPRVTIRQPVETAESSGTYRITGTASAPNGTLDRVEVRIDAGPWEDANGTAEWDYTWNASAAGAGNHTIEARSWAGTSHSETARVNVTIENSSSDERSSEENNQAPRVTIEAPEEDAVVHGTVMVEGTARDHDGEVETVELRINGGAWQQANGTRNWTFTWDTDAFVEGEHMLEARAHDEQAPSPLARRTVTVDRPAPNRAPTVSFLSPEENAWVSGEVAVTGNASDPDADPIVRTEVRIDDGPWEPAVGTANWTFTWNTTELDGGDHVIAARAFDAKNASQQASLILRVVHGQRLESQAASMDAQADGSSAVGRPQVSVVLPSPGSTVEGVLSLEGQASSSSGAVETVQFRLDGGPWQEARVSGEGRFEEQVDVSSLEPGSHVLSVRAEGGGATSQVEHVQFVLESGNLVPGVGVVLTTALLGLSGQLLSTGSPGARRAVKGR